VTLIALARARAHARSASVPAGGAAPARAQADAARRPPLYQAPRRALQALRGSCHL